jgi:hypothetical protein
MSAQKTIDKCPTCESHLGRQFNKRSTCPHCLTISGPSMAGVIPGWAREEYAQVCKEFEKEFARLNGGRK